MRAHEAMAWGLGQTIPFFVCRCQGDAVAASYQSSMHVWDGKILCRIGCGKKGRADAIGRKLTRNHNSGWSLITPILPLRPVISRCCREPLLVSASGKDRRAGGHWEFCFPKVSMNRDLSLAEAKPPCQRASWLKPPTFLTALQLIHMGLSWKRTAQTNCAFGANRAA